MYTNATAKLLHDALELDTLCMLRGGTYHLNTTLELNGIDSFLTITSYGGEHAVVSGAALLSKLAWTRSSARGTPYVATLTTAQAALLDAVGGQMPALRVEGRRSTRARYPNANVELDLFPIGYVPLTSSTKWRPPVYPPYNRPESKPCNPHTQCGPSTNLTIDSPAGEWHGMYQNYEQGYGGACEVYDPPRSPWCSGRFYLERQFPEMHTRMPSGVFAAPHLPNGPYKDARGAVVTAWRPHHWYTWMFEVAEQTIGPEWNASALLFGAGGNQGGEGADTADEWWIENVAEELDAPNEFFYDKGSRELRLIYNGSRDSGGNGPPPEVEVPLLTNLIELRGSLSAPVTNVTIDGLSFVDTRPSFLEPRGNPSGGDWALERLGAVFLDGTEGVVIRASNFSRLDSNAIFLSGYNRHAAIVENEFAWLGQSAIAAWGRLDGETNEGLSGDQPRHTLIKGNLCREIGHIQKQSSFYFQAITAQTTLEDNVVFNIPRAAINFNDGFGGGNLLRRNVLFNTCRESSDHGAFNSWDRLPYVTTIGDGSTPSTIPAFTVARANFIVANYGADGGCLDNDDGTSYYKIVGNVCFFGGHKSDFDGHTKLSYGNLHVHPSVYGVKCVGELQTMPRKGYAEGYYNNTCILPTAGATYVRLADCPGGLKNDSKSIAALHDGMLLGNNTVFVPGGEAVISCGNAKINSSEFRRRGYDVGTVFKDGAPSNATIAMWAKALWRAA